MVFAKENLTKIRGHDHSYATHELARYGKKNSPSSIKNETVINSLIYHISLNFNAVSIDFYLRTAYI
jgi:hypothetical protein